MCKQYHFRPAEDGFGFDAWDVDRLIELARGLPVEAVPLQAIGEIDTGYWFEGSAESPTVRKVVEHTMLILQADLSDPIILGSDGRVSTTTTGHHGPVAHLEIRRAIPADAAAVRRVIERAIRASAARTYPPGGVDAWASGGTLEAVERMIEETYAVVATFDEIVAGWANLDGDEVDQLYVDPDAAGRGLARRLYESVEQLARLDGLPELRAIASLRAEPVFRRFGFREAAREERIFGGHIFRVVRMTKRLDQSSKREAGSDNSSGSPSEAHT